MIRSIQIFGIFVLVVFSEAAYIKSSYNHAGTMDYFVLAQMWPQTTCWALNNEWQSFSPSCTSCSKKVIDTWTVHGLWPNKYNRNNPFNCNNSSQFELNSISKDLEIEMNLKWPSYKTGVKNQIFWNHEWQKHGTCAFEVSETNSVKKYVSKTLRLSDMYNIKTLLEISNIVPGGTYEYDTIFNALYDALGVVSKVGCSRNSKNGQQYLSEVYICLDKSFRPIDCTFHPGCKPNLDVIYPKALKSCH